MLQTWNEAIVAPTVDESHPQLLTELAAAARQFDEVMNEVNEKRPISLRSMLEKLSDPGEVSLAREAHRLFADVIRARRAAST